MLIPTSVLKKLKDTDPDLPFCCIYPGGDQTGEKLPFIGEDNFFMHRVHKMGIKVLCNTDVQCLHMDLATGKYTAHPNVDLNDYKTLIKPTTILKEEDREFIDKRWHDRIPKNNI
jgi:hypothetical protein